MTTPKTPPIAVNAANQAFAAAAAREAAATAKSASNLSSEWPKVLPQVAASPIKAQQTPTSPLSGVGPLLPGTTPIVTAAGYAAASAATKSQAQAASKVADTSLLATPLSADSIEEVLKGLRDLSSYQNNALQQFDNSAYHFRLFMTPDRDVINFMLGAGQIPPATVSEYYGLLDKFQQVTIAETGATSYNITSTQIESLVSPNFKSVALNTTSIVMNIVEPNGVAFLDSMKNAALQLRVRDVRKTWCYLELTFKGYENGVTKPNLLSDEGLPNGGRWIWQVQITDIDTKLSAGGGEYKLTMVPYSESSLDAEARLTPDMMIAEGNTIKEFFDDLASSLNNSWYLRTMTDNYLSYQFKFHGVKGRPNITGDMVGAFALGNEDLSLDNIRYFDTNDTETDASAANSVTAATKADTVVIPSSGERASAETLVAAVRQIIPGVTVTSTRRSVKHNAEVGGKKYSQHIAGTAIDIVPPKMTAAALKSALAARKILVDVIDEGDHYHIQGSRLLTRPATSTQQTAKENLPQEKASTVAAPAKDSPIQVSPLSGLPRGQFARGTSMDEIVTTVFGACQSAQKLAKDSTANDQSPDDSIDTTDASGKVNDKGFRESVVFRCEPEVRVLTYDPVFKNYGKLIIYHIYGYVTQKPILSTKQITTANDPKVQKAMLATIAKQGLLRKKYNYLYTGENLEILDLDISYNLTWAAVLPRLLRNEAYTAQSRFDTDVIKKYAATTDVVQLAQQIDSDRQEAVSVLTAANQAVAENATAENIERQKKAQADVTNVEAELTKVTSVLAKNRQELIKNLPTFNQADAMNGKKLLAEDLDSSTVPALNDMSITVKYAQEDPRNSLADGMTGQVHNGRTIYGTIINQLEGQMTGAMTTLNMKILGDPYWIGPANMEQAVRRERDIASDKIADYTIGDNAITLEFAYPLGTDDNGNVKLKKSETFTGLYQITKVMNDFSDGKFTQTVEGLRMPLLDLFKATATDDKK